MLSHKHVSGQDIDRNVYGPNSAWKGISDSQDEKSDLFMKLS